MSLRTLMAFAMMGQTSVEFQDNEEPTVRGIDKLMIMVKFLAVMNAEGKDEIAVKQKEFEAFLEDGINRPMTTEEKIKLYEGTIAYNGSQEATDDRLECMKYLFELKFLND